MEAFSEYACARVIAYINKLQLEADLYVYIPPGLC